MVDETDFLATCLSLDDDLLSLERIYKHGIVYAHNHFLFLIFNIKTNFDIIFDLGTTNIVAPTFHNRVSE
jgi:hypothetical protein